MTSIREAVHDVHQVLRITAVSWIMAIITFLLVVSPDQSLEGLRFIGENAVAQHRTLLDRVVPGALLFVAVLASLTTWYWARVALYVLAPGAPNGSRVTQWSARHLPRIAGLLPNGRDVRRALARDQVEGRTGGRSAIPRMAHRDGRNFVVVLYLFFIARRKMLRALRVEGRHTVAASTRSQSCDRTARRRATAHHDQDRARGDAGVLAAHVCAHAGIDRAGGSRLRNGVGSPARVHDVDADRNHDHVLRRGTALSAVRSILVLALLFAVFNWTDNRLVRYSTRATADSLPGANATSGNGSGVARTAPGTLRGRTRCSSSPLKGAGCVRLTIPPSCSALSRITALRSRCTPSPDQWCVGWQRGRIRFAATVAQHARYRSSTKGAAMQECRALADTLPATEREYE